jgi:CHASE2 domain-containing sensor protein
MDIWQRVTNRLGALPARRVTWGLVLTFSVWALLDIFVFQLSHGITQSSFDAMVRARVVVAKPDPRIIIVDIDEASLARMGKEFGRWPWPRDTLATVLEHIERQTPLAIAWDIVFSDADRLSPGGDAAFNEAAARSRHSHFPVVRLPQANDAASQLTREALPGLWLATEPGAVAPSTGGKVATVALIAPALPAVAGSRLGYNNGYVDPDGVLRRYRYLDPLADGHAIQSLPLSVLNAINPVAYRAYAIRPEAAMEPKNELIAWRHRADAYPRVPFADVFAQAEGGKPLAPVPAFAGKVVIIGATAPSLHDIHPTPLSAMQAGVDSMATVIDNALNQRHIRELPRWLQAALAIALCVGLALWVQFKSVASLAPALLALPAALLAVSYLSLNGFSWFIDLHLAAGLALLFLAVLRFWSTLRRAYWCTPLLRPPQALAIWTWERSDAWLEAPLDRLIDALERHAPGCRIVIQDTSIIWPNTLRWPELACCMALVGPHDALVAARAQLEPALKRLARRNSEIQLLDLPTNRKKLANVVVSSWSRLQNRDNNPD